MITDEPAKIVVRSLVIPKDPGCPEPTDARSFVIRGLDRWWNNQYDKALADYDAAIRLDPKNSDAFVIRGQARWFVAKYKDALDDYNEAVRLNPRSVWAS